MTEGTARAPDDPELPQGVKTDPDYWHSLIDEKVAADFLDVTPRYMQAMRQRGDGPRFIRLSPRCIKYTRGWLRAHVLARLRTSTSDLRREDTQ